MYTDSMVNLVSGLAAPGMSKSASDAFVMRRLEAQEAAAIYRSDWMGRKVIDAPVFDMFREWRDWQAEGPLIEAMESAEDHHGIAGKISRAVRMARLCGGSGIIIGADVANPEKPLDPKRIGKGGLKYLTVVAATSLLTPQMDTDPRSPTFGRPLYYELRTNEGAGVRLHPSRVIPFYGPDRLEDDLNRIDPWGDSVLLSVYDAIHNAALAQTAIAELVHEAKVDVIHVENLGSLVSSDAGTSALLKRFQAANVVKSINKMLLLDKSEVWDRKQTSFAGLPDLLDRYLQIVAAAADIPATRLLGTTAKGLNNSGDGDLRNYYDMLAGLRKQAVAPQLMYLDQVLWIDATGSIPKEAYSEWCPMWQLTEKETADIGKTKAETTAAYLASGLLPEEALAEAVTNQLIEDGTYPGLEAAIAALKSAGNDPGTADPASPDNTPPDRSIDRVRANLPRLAYAAR